MDEPFAAVDAQTRITLQEELNAIAQATRKTIMFVTHNVDEAVFLGDRCCILSRHPGRVKALVPISIPRAQRTWKLFASDPTFDATREHVLKLVREEVTAGSRRTAAGSGRHLGSCSPGSSARGAWRRPRCRCRRTCCRRRRRCSRRAATSW